MNSALIIFSGLMSNLKFMFVIELNEAIVWIEWIGMYRFLSWASLQSLEEKEHVIRIMNENVSQFVRLIVKECINRNLVRVWSLLFWEKTTIIKYWLLHESLNYGLNAWIWGWWRSCFDSDSHLAKKLTMCLNELSLVPSLSLMNYWLIEP